MEYVGARKVYVYFMWQILTVQSWFEYLVV